MWSGEKIKAWAGWTPRDAYKIHSSSEITLIILSSMMNSNSTPRHWISHNQIARQKNMPRNLELSYAIGRLLYWPLDLTKRMWMQNSKYNNVYWMQSSFPALRGWVFQNTMCNFVIIIQIYQCCDVVWNCQMRSINLDLRRHCCTNHIASACHHPIRAILTLLLYCSEQWRFGPKR
jgi:hypothetical protein